MMRRAAARSRRDYYFDFHYALSIAFLPGLPLLWLPLTPQLSSPHSCSFAALATKTFRGLFRHDAAEFEFDSDGRRYFAGSSC